MQPSLRRLARLAATAAPCLLLAAAASSTAPIYTTEPKGFFVLTQFCWGDASAGDEALLSGSVLGLVATDRQTCRVYEPGLAFGPLEALTCENTGNGFPLVCTITGVQTGK